MPLRSNDSEKEILDYIFRECSTLELTEQEKIINTYFAIKHHLPSSLFNSKDVTFSYNKGKSYILVSHKELQLYKIPNTQNPQIEMICPPNKEFVVSLDVSDMKKDATLKRYSNTNAKYWQMKFTPDEILRFSSSHWAAFKLMLENI